jgi:hypothetical protein
MIQGMLVGVEQDQAALTPLQKFKAPSQWIGSFQLS